MKTLGTNVHQNTTVQSIIWKQNISTTIELTMYYITIHYNFYIVYVIAHSLNLEYLVLIEKIHKPREKIFH